MKKLLTVLLCGLLLSGCGNAGLNENTPPPDTSVSAELNQTLQTDATGAEATGQTEPQASVSNDLVTFTIYKPNENLDGFTTEQVTGEKLSVLEALINAGILPLTFANPDDYDKFQEGDMLEIKGFAAAVKGATEATLVNKTNGETATLVLTLSQRQRDMLAAGGCLNYTKNQ